MCAMALYGVVLPMNLFCFILLLSFSLPHNPHTSVDSWALVIFLIAFFFPPTTTTTTEECGCPARHIDEMAMESQIKQCGVSWGCWATGLLGCWAAGTARGRVSVAHDK